MTARSNTGNTPTTTTILVGGLVVVLMVLTIAWFFLIKKGKPTTNANTNANVNVSNVNGGGTRTSTTSVAGWTTLIFTPADISVLIPPGMNVCDDAAQRRFSLSNENCDAKQPSFVFQRNGTWDAMTTVTAFDDAYAQELREAGLTTIEGRGTSHSGEGTTALSLKLSEKLRGSIVAEVNSPGRKVAVDARLDVPPVINGDTVDAEEIMTTILENITFIPTQSSAPTTTSPSSRWKTFMESSVGYTIDYPSQSVGVAVETAADLSVQFGQGTTLSVRHGSTVDETRGTTEGYRKLTEKTIVINSQNVIEERFVPLDGSPNRLLFVHFTEGQRNVGITYVFSGTAEDELVFEDILRSFKFTKESPSDSS